MSTAGAALPAAAAICCGSFVTHATAVTSVSSANQRAPPHSLLFPMFTSLANPRIPRPP
jgi:hypothetical protein